MYPTYESSTPSAESRYFYVFGAIYGSLSPIGHLLPTAGLDSESRYYWPAFILCCLIFYLVTEITFFLIRIVARQVDKWLAAKSVAKVVTQDKGTYGSMAGDSVAQQKLVIVVTDSCA